MQIAIITSCTEYAVYSPEGLSQAAAEQELQAIIDSIQSEDEYLIRPWCIFRHEDIVGAHLTDDPKDLNDILGMMKDDAKDDEQNLI